MKPRNRFTKYYRFIAYLVVVVLVNIVGITLFLRADLTSDRLYSLSEASKKAVATLSEPLTINVFFTKNLPAPHNNTERYLHDLLEEYSIQSNRFFNYRFYDVSAEEGAVGEQEKRNQEMARNYGIYPVQVQSIEQDEVKFQQAYMGMVMIHGDVIDKIPAITSTEGLEYTITSKIDRMNAKISKLLNLEEPVRIKLIFSSSLVDIAPQLRMEDLVSVPEKVEAKVQELNEKYYGKLSFARFDPSADSSLVSEVSRYNIITLRWPSIKDRSGSEVVSAGRGSAGLVVEKGGKFAMIPLIQAFNLPLFGTQYQLTDIGEIEERLSEAIDDVIDINKKIGYLADHGTLPLGGMPQLPGQQQQQLENVSNFNTLISDDYSVDRIRLKEGGIQEGIDCLIIAGPREEFTEYELFQIDQFLMKGKSLAVLLDPFDEIVPSQNQQMMNYNQRPIYRPINTGLERLLSHYGVEQKKSYILDKNCYEQQLPQIYGGGKRPIYFAPIIKEEHINNEYAFMKNIKALVALKSSPVELKTDRLKASGLQGEPLFASSEQSWEMSGRIDLSPWSMTPPASNDEMESRVLAVMVTGEFPSYFAGKPIPEKPADEEPETDGEGEDEQSPIETEPPGKDTSGAGDTLITGEGTIIEKGKPGKLLLVGTAEILKNSVIDEEGESPNATFIMNALDDLNGRDDYAAMRSKVQRYNPLRDTEASTKAFVKTFNIAGLPVIVVVFGITVWMRRTARKRAIEDLFSKGETENRK